MIAAETAQHLIIITSCDDGRATLLRRSQHIFVREPSSDPDHPLFARQAPCLWTISTLTRAMSRFR